MVIGAESGGNIVVDLSPGFQKVLLCCCTPDCWTFHVLDGGVSNVRQEAETDNYEAVSAAFYKCSEVHSSTAGMSVACAHKCHDRLFTGPGAQRRLHLTIAVPRVCKMSTLYWSE